MRGGLADCPSYAIVRRLAQLTQSGNTRIRNIRIEGRNYGVDCNLAERGIRLIALGSCNYDSDVQPFGLVHLSQPFQRPLATTRD